MKIFRSNPLQDLITALSLQNEILGRARAQYLSLEAIRKFEEASLVKVAPGKSHAEKLVNAQATQVWLAFHKKLARAEAIYEFQRLKFTVLEKEYQACYLGLKLDAGIIKKGAE